MVSTLLRRLAHRTARLGILATLVFAGLPVAVVAQAGRASVNTVPDTGQAGPGVADSAAQAGATDTMPKGAGVAVGSDTLFRLYGALGPFSAEARATAVMGRLRQVDAAIASGDSIVVVDRESYSELAVGEMVLMTVLDADAEAVGAVRTELARRYAGQLVAAIKAAAKATSIQAIAIGIGYALLATLVLVLLLRLIAWGFPKLYARIDLLRQMKLPELKLQNLELLSASRISTMIEAAAKVARALLVLLLFYLYVPLVLSFFPWTEALAPRIIGLVLDPFASAWWGFLKYLPNLLYLGAGIVILRYILRLLYAITTAIGSGTIAFEGFPRSWAEPTYKLVRVLVLAFGVTVLYPYLPGSGSDAFKGMSLFLGVLFSLGSSASIGNVLAGIVLTYTRSFEIGDRVKIGETVGDVVEKTLLVTRLRTIKNVSVTVPNGTVLNTQVINYTTLAKERGLILNTSVTIGYDVPWKQVHQLLLDAAKRTEHILEEPAPFVFQTSLGDFYVSYELNAYTNRADAMAVIYSGLHSNIQDTFNEGGVEIMSPHYATLRDGNLTTIPAQYLPSEYRAPAFQVEHRTADGAG